jgi:putative peptide zinc metalloprotease protein
MEAAAMSETVMFTEADKKCDLVADLRPCLKSQITIRRHRYRGEICYVLEDCLTRQHYRFSESAYQVVGRMTGQHTCQDIYESLQGKEKLQPLSQETFITILMQLAQMEALVGELPQELQHQPLAAKNKKKLTLLDQTKRSPLFLRLPLFNPSPVLSKYQRLFAPIHGTFFLVFLCFLFAAAFIQLILIWPELTHNAVDRIFTQHNLVILWLIYPLVKTVHEFAHAFSVKYYGGDVSEMGIMLLLFMPVPYVNASDSASFSNKWQRIGVAGAGILAELSLASVAILLWAAVEPGLIRTIAFNIILICGFSTLLFNGNPLVRYDGYYILSDLIEIPNLAAKSSSFIWYHILHTIAGIRTGNPPQGSAAEKNWFILYGIASFFYRLTIYSSIFYLFASKLGPIGAIIGSIAIIQILYQPISQRLRLLLASPEFIQKRKRSLTSVSLFAAAIFLFLCLIPLPYTTTSEGVVWLSDKSLVKMKTPGIITAVAVLPGTHADKEEVLFKSEDLQLHHNVLLLESQVKELQLKETAAFAHNPFEARTIREQLNDLRERLDHQKTQEQELLIKSPLAGNLVIHSPKTLTGRFFKQGETLGFIQSNSTTIRTLASEEDIDLIFGSLSYIEITIVTEPGRHFTGTIISKNPQSTYHLPSPALGTTGGGKILLNPEDRSQLTTLEEMFQLDIELDQPLDNFFPDSRAFIKYHYKSQPLLFRWTRSIRQLFLNKFRG